MQCGPCKTGHYINGDDFKVYSGTVLPIFMEIGLYLTDKGAKYKFAQFFETRCTSFVVILL